MLRIFQSVQPFSYLISLGSFFIMMALLMVSAGGLNFFSEDWWWLPFGAILLGFLWNRMVNSNEFKNREQSLTFWVWCLWGPFLIALNQDWTWLVNNFLLGAMLFHLGPIHRQQDTKNRYFNAAFFGGVALCISLNYSWLLLGLLISLTYTRSGVWREWAWAIIGFLLPGMLKMVICWVFFEGFDWFHQWMATLTLVPKELSFHWGYIPLLVLFFWGLTGFLGSYIDSSIKGRNTRTVWLIMMLSYLLCGIFESEYSFSNISLWILPIVSILIGFCLLSRRVRWWQKVLFWLVLSAVSISLVGLVFN